MEYPIVYHDSRYINDELDNFTAFNPVKLFPQSFAKRILSLGTSVVPAFQGDADARLPLIGLVGSPLLSL